MPTSLSKRRILSLAVAGALTAAVFTASQATGAQDGGQDNSDAQDAHWVDTWTSMPQLTEPGNMPPPPFTGTNVVFANSTLRQTIRVTVGGQHMRLRISNA